MTTALSLLSSLLSKASLNGGTSSVCGDRCVCVCVCVVGEEKEDE